MTRHNYCKQYSALATPSVLCLGIVWSKHQSALGCVKTFFISAEVRNLIFNRLQLDDTTTDCRNIFLCLPWSMYYLNMYPNVQLFTHITHNMYPKMRFWVHVWFDVGIFLHLRYILFNDWFYCISLLFWHLIIIKEQVAQFYIDVIVFSSFLYLFK